VIVAVALFDPAGTALLWLVERDRLPARRWELTAGGPRILAICPVEVGSDLDAVLAVWGYVRAADWSTLDPGQVACCQVLATWTVN
jgi:hypothetical protein